MKDVSILIERCIGGTLYWTNAISIKPGSKTSFDKLYVLGARSPPNWKTRLQLA
ncbi:hypothetical protein O9992_03545 [Vibrio lentus]|nr:hypothetical protein [Vibrio lentus]